MAENTNKDILIENSKKERSDGRKAVILILSIIAMFILLFSIFLFTRYGMNLAYILEYANGNKLTKMEKLLTKVNFPDSYVPYYNLGNQEYDNGNYEEAINYYERALANNPPHEGEECLTRINIALSLIGTINFDDLDSVNKIDAAIETLQEARNYLTENECADPDGEEDFHNEDAEQLKEDIDAKIKELEEKKEEMEQDPTPTPEGQTPTPTPEGQTPTPTPEGQTPTPTPGDDDGPTPTPRMPNLPTPVPMGTPTPAPGGNEPGQGGGGGGPVEIW